MASLPATIVSSSTIAPSEYKVASIGPFGATIKTPLIEQMAETAGLVANVGDNTTEYARQTVDLPGGSVVARVDAFCGTVGGTPADGLTCELRAVDGTVLASATLAGSVVVGSGTLAWMSWDVPDTVVAASNNPHQLVWYRTGAQSTTVYYRLCRNSANPYAGGSHWTCAVGSSTWVEVATDDLVFRVADAATVQALFVPLNDRTPSASFPLVPRLWMYRSLDGGRTWTEADASGGASLTQTTTAGRLVGSADTDGTTITFAYVNASNVAKVATFHLDVCAWERGGGFTPPATTATNVTGAAPLGVFQRTPVSGSYNSVLVCQATAETIMATGYRRAKILYDTNGNGSGAWTTLDLATGTAALPGTQVHYDVRIAVKAADRVHAFYSRSDSTGVRVRTLSYANALSAEIQPANAAVWDQTQNYPMGLPIVYQSGGNTWIAAVYVDGATTKVMRARSDLADVATNWTVETAVGTASEQATCPPGFLATDNGNRLYLIRVVATTRTLEFCHDRGLGAWLVPSPWRSGAATPTVDLVSARVLGDRIALAYYDTVPTPDEVRYDNAWVFFPKQSYAVGTHEATIDVGEFYPAMRMAIDNDAAPSAAAVATIGPTSQGAEGSSDGYGEAIVGDVGGLVTATMDVTGAAMVVGLVGY